MTNLFQTKPLGLKENMFLGEKFRFTFLTPRLVRMEYSGDGVFEDRPTQTVLNREFAPVSWRKKDKGEGFELFTDSMRITYDGKEFSGNGLMAYGQGGLFPHGSVWRYGETDKRANLKGTVRTLDEVEGACELEDGIMSIMGCAVLDDSGSLVLTEDGWVAPRKPGICDLYLFMYGTDYEDALSDYYRLTGKTPLLPRFALGNWWSRYYEYTEDSYKELMNKFQEERIPLSVAVIDMDWHLVKSVDPKYGSGWTGFTWNREMFPDPPGFLSWLKEQGMHTTLNLHPADGIRAYEEAYPRIAEVMGVDMEAEEPVEFDIADPKFAEAYFSCVLHPLEEEGVDFWWLDWQQGSSSGISGLDPLWMLNHLHFMDSARDGKRPMTFSRYAGYGSHRYPVGFSGDTVASWPTLEFQPYFTSTASNVGYGWWSHDIGGHMFGYRDNEMALRWVQFGVFSPINRLHSTKGEFRRKEPWSFPMEIHEVMNEFLRLRHKMIPYLYTMNYRAYKEDKPLIEPMYYKYPREWNAYGAKNQYFFGEELMVAPITSPQIDKLNLGRVKVWLPEGIWIDFFTGILYEGGRQLEMYRDLHSIPVLAKAGAIIPMTEEIQKGEFLQNPKTLELAVFGGGDGAFTLYEDDNETLGYLDGKCVTTPMRMDWVRGILTIESAVGCRELIPEARSYTVHFYGVKKTRVSVYVNGLFREDAVKTAYDEDMRCLTVVLPAIPVTNTIRILLAQTVLRENPVTDRIFGLLERAEIEYELKDRIFSVIEGEGSAAAKLSELQAMRVGEDLFGCIAELLTAEE